MFSYVVHGPLKILKESWLAVNDDPVSLLECDHFQDPFNGDRLTGKEEFK